MSHTEIKSAQVSSRGGRRPGSGRKKLHRVSLLLRISPEADQALRLAAQRIHSTPSRIVESLVLEKAHREMTAKHQKSRPEKRSNKTC